MRADKDQIFVSYSRKDSEFALKITRDLKSAGFDIWIDQLDIPAGSHFDYAIEQALKKSGSFIVILTPEAIKSENVKDEMGYAIDTGKLILPILLQECNIPLRLRRFQIVNFTNRDYNNGIDYVKISLSQTSRVESEKWARKQAPLQEQEHNSASMPKATSIRRESLFRRVLHRLAGDTTTGAPPPKKKNKRGE